MRWSSLLLKQRFSDSFIAIDLSKMSLTERKVYDDFKFKYQGIITDDKILKLRKDLLKVRLKSATDEFKDFISSFKYELKEILADSKFKKSEKGKFILYCNDFIQMVYDKMRKNNDWDNVFIGSKPDDLLIIVHGKIKSYTVFTKLLKLLSLFKCESDIEYQIKILNTPPNKAMHRSRRLTLLPPRKRLIRRPGDL